MKVDAKIKDQGLNEYALNWDAA